MEAPTRGTDRALAGVGGSARAARWLRRSSAAAAAAAARTELENSTAAETDRDGLGVGLSGPSVVEKRSKRVLGQIVVILGRAYPDYREPAL